MTIVVENLKHTYSPGSPEESLALNGVSFEVADGESLGIIGHTGSGKTTLLQHLNGLLKPDSGTITVNGTVITGDAEKEDVLMVRKKVGFVFQYPEYQLFEETVEKDVAFGPRNLELPEEEIKRRVRWALEMVGLDYDDIKDDSPFNLSGGQKRRVAIAGVIAMEPEVLILDEPTAGLDPKAHDDILAMIGDIHKKTGNINILVSHNMNDVTRFCDKILVMDRGQKVLYGTPGEVFSETEKLLAMGLDLPDGAHIAHRLRKEGMDLPDDILTIDQLEREILKAKGRE